MTGTEKNSGIRLFRWRVDRRWLVWGHNAVGTVIIAAFLYYLWQHREQLSNVENLSALDLSLLALLSVLTGAVNAVQGLVLYRAVGLGIGFWESFALSMATGFGNYLPARTGTLLRAHYLKSVHGLRFARYGSLLSIRTVLTIMAAGAAGLGCTLWLLFSSGTFSLQLIVIFSLLLISPMTAFLWRPREARGDVQHTALMRVWHDFAIGFRDLKAQPRVSMLVFIFFLVQYVLLAARFMVAANGTVADEPVAMLLLMAPLAALMGYVSLTPGGFGLRELVMGYTSLVAGASFAEGMLVGAIDRAVLLVVMAAVGGPCFVWLWWSARRGSRAT